MKKIKQFIHLDEVTKKFHEEVEGAMYPAEALFGFAGWLTSLEEPVIASCNHGASVWADMVGEFCKENGLNFVRNDWTDYLTFPKTREIM